MILIHTIYLDSYVCLRCVAWPAAARLRTYAPWIRAQIKSRPTLRYQCTNQLSHKSQTKACPSFPLVTAKCGGVTKLMLVCYISEGLQLRSTTWQGMGRLTFVWDPWLSCLCTGIPLIDSEFDPRHTSVTSCEDQYNTAQTFSCKE